MTNKPKSTTNKNSANKEASQEKKQRIHLPHPNDFSFFIIHNIPDHSFLAIKRDNKLVSVWDVSANGDHAFTELLADSKASIGYSAVAGMLKQRGGPTAFATLQFDHNIDLRTVTVMAIAMVNVLPHNVKFVTSPAPSVAEEVKTEATVEPTPQQ